MVHYIRVFVRLNRGNLALASVQEMWRLPLAFFKINFGCSSCLHLLAFWHVELEAITVVWEVRGLHGTAPFLPALVYLRHSLEFRT